MENKLNELNIFALRDLARKTGVKTPTSKKKEELIKEITEIMTGKRKPEGQKTKQGRPPKVFGYNFASVFVSNLESSTKLSQPESTFENDDIKTVAGWLELINDNSALLWVNKEFKNDIYFVPNQVLQNFNVKMGDRIVAEVNSDEQQKIVKRIFSINDNPILKLPDLRIDYFEKPCVEPSVKLEFSNLDYNDLDLMLGQNFYFYGTDNNLNTKTMVDLINACNVENKFYVNVTVAEKNKLMLKNLTTTENFLCNIMDEEDVIFRLLTLMIERTKRAFENGENVLLVVDDIASIAGLGKRGMDIVKNIVSLAKASNGCSITLIAVMPNELFAQIEKLADKRFLIEDEKIRKK